MSSVYHKGNVTGYQDGQVVAEYDLLLCCHCNMVFMIQPSHSANIWSPSDVIVRNDQRPEPKPDTGRRRGFCFRCMGPTCGQGKCVKCIPFEAQLEAMEGTRRFWNQMEVLTGSSY